MLFTECWWWPIWGSAAVAICPPFTERKVYHPGKAFPSGSGFLSHGNRKAFIRDCGWVTCSKLNLKLNFLRPDFTPNEFGGKGIMYGENKFFPVELSAENKTRRRNVFIIVIHRGHFSSNPLFTFPTLITRAENTHFCRGAKNNFGPVFPITLNFFTTFAGLSFLFHFSKWNEFTGKSLADPKRGTIGKKICHSRFNVIWRIARKIQNPVQNYLC